MENSRETMIQVCSVEWNDIVIYPNTLYNENIIKDLFPFLFCLGVCSPTTMTVISLISYWWDIFFWLVIVPHWTDKRLWSIDRWSSRRWAKLRGVFSQTFFLAVLLQRLNPIACKYAVYFSSNMYAIAPWPELTHTTPASMYRYTHTSTYCTVEWSWLGIHVSTKVGFMVEEAPTWFLAHCPTLLWFPV